MGSIASLGVLRFFFGVEGAAVVLVAVAVLAGVVAVDAVVGVTFLGGVIAFLAAFALAGAKVVPVCSYRGAFPNTLLTCAGVLFGARTVAGVISAAITGAGVISAAITGAGVFSGALTGGSGAFLAGVSCTFSFTSNDAAKPSSPSSSSLTDSNESFSCATISNVRYIGTCRRADRHHELTRVTLPIRALWLGVEL